jgi:predicted SprT family Zn-dependent metalloprotease
LLPIKREMIMPKAKPTVAITPTVHAKMQAAVDYLNAHLFDGELPDAFLVFQRRAHSGGHFAPDRYVHRDAKDNHQHEINLNPDHFVGETDEKILSILAHEMTHLWQHCYDKPVTSGYHDAKWGAKMKAIGLYPSSTGAPGGKETGHRMQHYVVSGGRFAEVFAALAATGWRLDLESAQRPGKRAEPNSKTKFTCPSCGVNAWGKPELAIACIPCGLRMIPPDAAAEPRTLAGVDVQPGQPM